MANGQQANVLTETRSTVTAIDEGVVSLVHLRDRFNALGGTPGFQGAGKLFAADGSGQEIPYNDFIGIFNALGALEGTSQWPAFLAVIERART